MDGTFRALLRYVISCPTTDGPASDMCCSHQFITRSLLEKKRCPPISIRLPLYSTVREMPPMYVLFSSSMGFTSDRVSSSYAAVKPAGPAPMMIAVLFTPRLMNG